MVSNDVPPITEAEVLRRLRRETELQGSIAAAAVMFGVPRQTLNHFILGRRRLGRRGGPAEKILKALGLKCTRFVIYRFEDAKGRPAAR